MVGPSLRLTIEKVAELKRLVWDALARAEVDWHERSLRVAGRSYHLRCRSADYLDLCLETLAWLPVAADEACEISLTIVARDALHDLPAIGWDESSFSIKALNDALMAEGLKGTYDPDYDLWQFYDPKERVGVYLPRREGLFPPWEASFPLRNFVHWACDHDETGLLHAGTVGLDGKGVFVVGPGGSGKSGTTLSGILYGLSSVGDDYVHAALSDGQVIARQLVAKMKQDEKGLRRLGLDAADPAFDGPNWQDKYSFDFAGLGRGPRVEQLAMRAILLPKVAHAPRTELVPAKAKDAMLHLAPSSLYQLSGDWKRTMAHSAQICRALPAYHLMLSEDPAEIALSLKTFLEGQAA